jgi:hypothetical protein
VERVDCPLDDLVKIHVVFQEPIVELEEIVANDRSGESSKEALLNRIPLKMKTIDHGPGDKLAELFVHILAGGMHVKELETSPHPPVRDPAVAHA